MIFVLKPGDRGQEVRRLQNLLLVHTSGVYDAPTESAVRALQTANKLTIDGQAGPQVLGKLGIYPSFGVDLSHHNNVLSWKDLAAERDFVYLKATEGVTFLDPTFWKQAENAFNYKVKVRGAYCFGKLIRDPVQTADHYLDILLEARARGLINARPMLDLENGGLSMSSKTVQQWALSWAARVVEKTGDKPLLYTYLPFIKDSLGGGDLLTETFDLWAARYRGGRVVDPVGGGLDLGAFQSWLIYQYSAGQDGKQVAGCGVGKIDQDILAGGDLSVLLSESSKGCK